MVLKPWKHIFPQSASYNTAMRCYINTNISGIVISHNRFLFVSLLLCSPVCGGREISWTRWKKRPRTWAHQLGFNKFQSWQCCLFVLLALPTHRFTELETLNKYQLKTLFFFANFNLGCCLFCHEYLVLWRVECSRAVKVPHTGQNKHNEIRHKQKNRS